MFPTVTRNQPSLELESTGQIRGQIVLSRTIAPDEPRSVLHAAAIGPGGPPVAHIILMSCQIF